MVEKQLGRGMSMREKCSAVPPCWLFLSIKFNFLRLLSLLKKFFKGHLQLHVTSSLMYWHLSYVKELFLTGLIILSGYWWLSLQARSFLKHLECKSHHMVGLWHPVLCPTLLGGALNSNLNWARERKANSNFFWAGWQEQPWDLAVTAVAVGQKLI